AGDGDFTRLPRVISIPATSRATPVQFEFHGVATVGRGRNPFKVAQVDGLLADTHVVLPVVSRIEGISNGVLVCDNRIIDVEELPLTLSVNGRLLTVDAVVDNPVDVVAVSGFHIELDRAVVVCSSCNLQPAIRLDRFSVCL